MNDMTPEALAASFDMGARADAAEAAIAAIDTRVGTLEGDMAQVKGRLDRVATAAARPVLAAEGTTSPETKGFVDKYLRRGQGECSRRLGTSGFRRSPVRRL